MFYKVNQFAIRIPSGGACYFAIGMPLAGALNFAAGIPFGAVSKHEKVLNRKVHKEFAEFAMV